MPRAQSKIMSKEDKKNAIADARVEVANITADLKSLKALVVISKKAVTEANKTLKKADRAVITTTNQLAKAKKRAANLRSAKS